MESHCPFVGFKLVDSSPTNSHSFSFLFSPLDSNTMRAASLSLALSGTAVLCQSAEESWQAPGPNDSMLPDLFLRDIKGSNRLIKITRPGAVSPAEQPCKPWLPSP